MNKKCNISETRNYIIGDEIVIFSYMWRQVCGILNKQRAPDAIQLQRKIQDATIY